MSGAAHEVGGLRDHMTTGALIMRVKNLGVALLGQTLRTS
jgi:hypothetical protein